MKKITLLLSFFFVAGLAQAQKAYTYVQSPMSAASQDIFKSKLYTTTNLMEVREEIGLTEVQVAKIKKLHAENSGQFSTLKWDLDDATSKMRKMLDQPKINAAEVSRQLDEVLRLENQMKRIQMNTMVAIKNELTPEQISKLEQPKMFYFNRGNVVTEDKLAKINGKSSRIIVDGAAISTSPKVEVTVIGNGEQPLYFLETKSGMKKVISFEQIDPKDIESVSVLKGEQALEKYGADGKNGVVVIKLKNMPE
ncbi:Spy/CpxP family protein refolding chaperone [Algoriphagus mannitolivorans]|uniref:Spy/CpxP family protein refolding chaperone n=1 Tax=Algoriphagus mannitolivorans TaxID=226504 RepID=UPI000424A138|nr:Spy/CpxP family protein refolding chaperone [Algoriphagus mannitolivorans]